IQRRLLQDRLHRSRIQEIENIAERKTVLLSQSNVQTVVRSRGLQFKIEPHTKSLAQSQSPGLVDPPSKRSVNHQLHSAAFIEEALRNHGSLCRHRTQHSPPLQNVFNRLLRARVIQPALFS